MPKEISQQVKLKVFEGSEVPKEIAQLINEAKLAASKAYAPYSNFQVGAALLLQNGKVITGNNQENACYPAGLCAERVAFFSAKSQYPDVQIESVAIVAKRREDTGFKLATPCGSCRQVMSEYELGQKKPISVYLSDDEERVYLSDSIDNFLPFKFSGDSL